MSKTWFITGAARGIGAEIAKAALAAGDKVVLTARNTSQLAASFASYAEQALFVELDVSNEMQARSAVAAAVFRFGRIDVLVNNAGYGQLGAFEEIEAGDIERQFATNVYGTFHVTRAVLPVLRRQRAGHIFNLSSIGGVQGFKEASIYCASKFAVEGFSESLALEIAPFGIHVTLVEPGFFRTDFLDGRSVHYGTLSIDDYAASSAATRAAFDQHSHQQAGDPAKLASALLQLAALDKPPLRYAAGSDAVEIIHKTLAAHCQELDEWRALSVATDGNF